MTLAFAGRLEGTPSTCLRDPTNIARYVRHRDQQRRRRCFGANPNQPPTTPTRLACHKTPAPLTRQHPLERRPVAPWQNLKKCRQNLFHRKIRPPDTEATGDALEGCVVEIAGEMAIRRATTICRRAERSRQIAKSSPRSSRLSNDATFRS